MGHQQLYQSHLRKEEIWPGFSPCRICSHQYCVIWQYGLSMCRQCFHQFSKDIGYIKLD
ncbi:40S ribosomal protein S29-like [Lynx canadensis]|uniref:40S ribosomal protein S29-like n=1 Tax=Lynx canadensis TaxID=61383 RepID=UPI0013C46B13|nr:40S ribosomal protein S29-like [Lynx canadensis]XP_044916658.1 40S ribosomal protein S29-like [Felis catus]